MSQGVQKLSVYQLSEAEQIELAKVFGTENFVSDEDEATVWFFLPLCAGLAGLGVGVVNIAELTETLNLVVSQPSLLPSLFMDVFFLAPLAGLVACGLIAWYFLRVHGKHGHAVTSFGVVQMRGPSLRVLRYEHIASISQHRFRVKGRRATETTLTAKDGTKLATYATRLVDTIRARAKISA